MSIKVGQIYKDRLLGLEVISFIERNTFGNIIHLISRNGGVMTCSYDGYCEDINERDTIFIAEYPTWQEAVNSEYFKND